MKFIVLPTREEIGTFVAREIAGELARDPWLVLGVATGSSPEPVYRALADAGIDLSTASAFALDEYVGLPAGHPESYREVLRQQLVGPLGLPAGRLHVPDGAHGDPEEEARRYDREIARAGGVGLQLLGIGRNGHIGFNEPGTALDSRTHVVDLAADTLEANARFFPGLDAVPRRAITQGLGTILEARRLVLVATGPEKAGAIGRMANGPISPELPASVLQRHPDVLVVGTEDAMSGLAEPVSR